MKDLRVEKLAKQLLKFSVKIKKGEKIFIEMLGTECIELASELINQSKELGAIPLFNIIDYKILKEMLLNCTEEQVKEYARFDLEKMKEADCYIGIRSAKFYKYYFDKVRRSETMEHFFPLWPLRQAPPFNQYSSKTSKWCRQCKEHYDYIKTYMDVLLQEYEYRNKKPHGLEKFLEWLECDAPQMNIPQGNIKKIVVPWKVLNPKYRRKDIQLGYRLQYKALLENDGIKITDFKNRDIPEFLMQQNSQWLE